MGAFLDCNCHCMGKNAFVCKPSYIQCLFINLYSPSIVIKSHYLAFVLFKENIRVNIINGREYDLVTLGIHWLRPKKATGLLNWGIL